MTLWVLGSLLGCGVQVDDEPSVGWRDLAPLLAPLQENSVVVLDGQVVVVGGIDPASVASPRVEAYSPGDDAWSSLPDLPAGRHHVNASVADGRLFALGGLGFGFEERGDGWVLEGDTWTSVAPMPPGRERGAAAVGVIDGQIHLVGGVRGSDVGFHDVYDPATDSWAALPDAPLARDHGGAAVIDGVLYAVGGRHQSIGSHLPALYAWDGDWTKRADMPTSRGGIAVTALDGRLHVIGGEGDPEAFEGVFDVHEAYDPATDSWETLPPPSVPRHGTGAAAIDGVLYLPGGADKQALGPIDANEAWTP